MKIRTVTKNEEAPEQESIWTIKEDYSERETSDDDDEDEATVSAG